MTLAVSGSGRGRQEDDLLRQAARDMGHTVSQSRGHVSACPPTGEGDWGLGLGVLRHG